MTHGLDRIRRMLHYERIALRGSLCDADHCAMSEHCCCGYITPSVITQSVTERPIILSLPLVPHHSSTINKIEVSVMDELKSLYTT